MGWTAIAVIDFYLKYQDTELLDLFTGPEGVLNQGCALFHSSVSGPSHYFSFFLHISHPLCHLDRPSTVFQTLYFAVTHHHHHPFSEQ